MKKFILMLLILTVAPLWAVNLPLDNSLPPAPEWAPVENAALS